MPGSAVAVSTYRPRSSSLQIRRGEPGVVPVAVPRSRSDAELGCGFLTIQQVLVNVCARVVEDGGAGVERARLLGVPQQRLGTR